MKLSEFSINALRELITGDSGLTPKQKGPQLVEMFGKFGIRDLYTFESGGGLPDGMSRNQYAFNRAKKLNGTRQLNGLLELLVDSRHFAASPQLEVVKAVEAINKIIINDGFRLQELDGVYKVIGEVEPDKIEVEVHFEDIQRQIIEELKTAKFIIWVAVAWFTDNVLFEVLRAKKLEGVNVQVIIIDDEINANSGLEFERNFETRRIRKLGKYENIMHNKFCVVDLRTVIHGSYNWTKKAHFNKEAVSIDVSRDLAEKFASQFIELKKLK
jgi:phosphatidylserine/phosphatidylglycerophosphate/cardiolipin synthase-like enzyme